MSDMPYSEYSLLSKNEDVYDQIDRLKKWFDGLSAEMEAQIALELDAILENIRSAAIELCPKESGALASSIEISSEGGSGVKEAGDFYGRSIYAGNDETFNFKGEPTSQYAALVHDGHFTVDGKWVRGVPFLDDAWAQYENELDLVVEKVMAENGWSGAD